MIANIILVCIGAAIVDAVHPEYWESHMIYFVGLLAAAVIFDVASWYRVQQVRRVR